MALGAARAAAALLAGQLCYSAWFLALRQADLRLNNAIYRYLQRKRLTLDLLGFSKAFPRPAPGPETGGAAGGAAGGEAGPGAGGAPHKGHPLLAGAFRAAAGLAWALMALIPLYLASVILGARRAGPAGQSGAPLGLELPRSHLGLTFGCFLASALIHEMFHALAMWACGEPVGEFGFGVRLFIPTFFVRARRPLAEISPRNRRAILAAGPVGNLCLSGALLLAMWLVYFLVIGSLCQRGAGITVLSFPGSEALSQAGRGGGGEQPRGEVPLLSIPAAPGIVNLSPGDVVEAVGSCAVAGPEDYRLCLDDLSRSLLFREPIVYDFDHSVTQKLFPLGSMTKIDHGEPKRLDHGGIRVDVDSGGYSLIYPEPGQDAEGAYPPPQEASARALASPQQLLASEPYVPGQQQFIRIFQPVRLKREARGLVGRALYARYPTFQEVSRQFCFRTSENDEDEGACFFPHSPNLPGYLRALAMGVPEGDEANSPFADEILDPDDLRIYLALKVGGEYRIVEASLRALRGLAASPYVLRKRDGGVLARLAGLGVDVPGVIDVFFRTFVQASLAMGVFALLPFPASSDGAQLLRTLEASGGPRRGFRGKGRPGPDPGPQSATSPARVMLLYTYTGLVAALFGGAIIVSVF